MVPGHSVPPLSTCALPVWEGGPCWGWGKEGSPPSPSPSLSCHSGRLCLECGVLAHPAARDCHHRGDSGDSSWGQAVGQGKDQDGSWELWDAHQSRGSTGLDDGAPRMDGQSGRGGTKLDDGGLRMGNGKHVGWALGSRKNEAGWRAPRDGHQGRGRTRLDGGIPRMGGIMLNCWLWGWELG